MNAVERWIAAMNRHDVDAAAECFAPDYSDEAPARRGEHVSGREEVRRNFATLFRDVPDLRADVLASATSGQDVWIEWRMTGRRLDGGPFEFAGVNIFTVRDDRLWRGRIYTELVRKAGGIEGQLDRMTRGKSE